MVEIIRNNQENLLGNIGLSKVELSNLKPYDKRNKLIIEISKFLGLSKEGGKDYFDKAYQKISSFKEIDYESLSSFQVIDGILVCYYDNGKTGFNNLTIKNDLLAQETIRTLKEEGLKISRETATHLQEAKKNIDKESIMGGAIVLSYATSFRVGNYFIDNIFFRSIDGSLKKVDLDDGGINIGNKQKLKGEIFKLLESKGFFYDSSKEAFFGIDDIKISTKEVKLELSKINYKDYKKFKIQNGEHILTESDFIKAKQGAINEIKSLNLKSNIKEIQLLLGKWGFGGLIMHSIFMPVFFRSFHSNSSDLASMGKSLSEMTLFMGLAKLGFSLPGNIITKPILGLIFGMGSIMLGENIAESIKLDKKFWLAFPDREDFWEKMGWKGKSFLTHALTFGTVNDLDDKLGFDIKIPGTPIEFVTTNVNLSTDPLKYMQSAIGRDLSFWNKRVEKFGNNISVDIYNLMVNYKKGTGDFSINSLTSIEDKFIDIASNGKYQPVIEKDNKQLLLAREKVLKEEIKKILNGHGEYNGFTDIKQSLLISILEIANNKKILFNKESISFIIKNEINKMKIDDIYIEKKQNEVKGMLKNIELLLGIYNGSGNSNNLSFTLQYYSFIKGLNKKQKDLIINIYHRILNKQELNGGNMFKNLINGEKGDTFVQLLNYMVECKRQIDFLKNIRTTGYAVSWGTNYI